jgi:hypothetical protein
MLQTLDQKKKSYDGNCMSGAWKLYLCVLTKEEKAVYAEKSSLFFDASEK